MKRLAIASRVLLASLCAAGICCVPVQADVPVLLHYQGVLTDGAGVAVADGWYDITFNIYDVAAGGSSLWTETNPVQVTKGIFNATIGTLSNLGLLAFDRTYYIGLSVEGGAELSRQILTTTPYAFTARGVLGLTNVFPPIGNVGIGTNAPAFRLDIQHDNNGSAPAIAIENNYGGGAQDMIDFRFDGATQGRIRKSRNGALFFEVDAGLGIRLQTAGVNRLSVLQSGNVGIANESPVEILDVAGGVKLGTTAATNAGTMRWTGSDFEGYDGSTWKSFTATGGSGLPAGSGNQTLRHNGVDWVASSIIYNNGSEVGINATAPAGRLHVLGTSTENEVWVENSSIYGDANVRLKTAGSTGDYLELYKGGPSAGGTTAGGIPLANLSRVATGSAAGPLMMQVISANPMYFVTNNMERMRLDANGNLGINTTVPGAKLHVDGNMWDVANTEGDFKIGDATHRLKFGVATAGDGAGTARIFAAGGAQKLILGGGTSEVLSIDGAGNTGIGGATSNAKLRLFRSGIDSAVVNFYTTARGGGLAVYDAGHALASYLEVDPSAAGGYFSVYRNAANNSGFYVDGNYGGTSEPRVAVVGSLRNVQFRMDQSDNGSVLLPTNAIGASELLDEPGVASYTEGASSVLIAGAGYTVLGSRSITVPAAGYVLVMATGEIAIDHVNGQTSWCYFGVSASATALPENQDVSLRINAWDPDGLYNFPVTPHGLFQVASAGTNTYYFLADLVAGSYSCYDVQLTLLYIPTSYGTVTPTVAGVVAGEGGGAARPGLDAAEIASERAQSIADNAGRVERELAEMRSRIEELEREARNR